MDVGKLTVEVRSAGGKNEARRLRAAGKVPGICYGRGGQPLPIALDAKALRGSLDPEKKQNTVIRMTVNGTAEGARELTVMLKDYQIDGLRREVRHVDFISIDVTKDVTVEVPIILTGKPVGVVEGGLLNAVYRELPVSCKPENIPVKIEVDVSTLGIGDALHVRDVKMPPGVKAAIGEGETIASVVAPKAEKTPDQEAAEAAAAAEAIAGVAPAEGAAPGAAPAAGAKPAREGKEKK